MGRKVVAPGICEVRAEVVQRRPTRCLRLHKEPEDSQHAQARVLDLLDLQLLKQPRGQEESSCSGTKGKGGDYL